MLELKLNLKHDDDISVVQSTSHKYAHGFVVFYFVCGALWVHALLWIYSPFYPYSSRLLHRYWGNRASEITLKDMGDRYLATTKHKKMRSVCIIPGMYCSSHCGHIWYYSEVTMGAMASQITRLTIVYSTVYSGADQTKHQRSVSPAFVRGIHRWPENSLHKGPVTRKMFPFDDVIMVHSKQFAQCQLNNPGEAKSTAIFKLSQ